MPVRSLSALALLFALLLGVAAPASATELRMRSGRALDVDLLLVLDRSVRVTMFRDGGSVQAEYAFTRLDAIAFLKSPHAKVLTPIQRKRFELLAYLQHLVAEREKASESQDKPGADEPEALKPAPPRPTPPPETEPEEPPRERPDAGEPDPRSGAGERFRERRPWRRDPPRVPGTERPGRGTGGSSSGSGGGSGGAGAGTGAGLK